MWWTMLPLRQTASSSSVVESVRSSSSHPDSSFWSCGPLTSLSLDENEARSSHVNKATHDKAKATTPKAKAMAFKAKA